MPNSGIHTLELVHVDFTSIETTMELNQLPSVKNVLVPMIGGLFTTDQYGITPVKGMLWRLLVVDSYY